MEAGVAHCPGAESFRRCLPGFQALGVPLTLWGRLAFSAFCLPTEVLWELSFCLSRGGRGSSGLTCSDGQRWNLCLTDCLPGEGHVELVFTFKRKGIR